jgi:4-amino-4-deoxy-L-arabinose transferase-like glycosyltransferase
MTLTAERDQIRGHLILLALLSVVCLWWGKTMRGFPLDPMIYAAVSRNLAEDGRWLNLSVGATMFPVFQEHPPLLFWLQALVFKVFGFSGFLARLVPLLASTGTVLCVYTIGRILSGARIGLAAAVLLLVSPQFLKYGTEPFTEPLLTFLSAAAVLCFLLAGRKHPAWLTAAGFLTGLGYITKGPVILAIPAALGLYHILTRRDERPRLPLLWIAAAAGAFILAAAIWFVPDALWNGSAWTAFFHKKQIFGTMGGRSAHTLRPFKYALIVLTYQPHIVILSAAAIFIAVRSRRVPPLLLLGLCWSLSFLLPFSLMKWKLEHYIHPSYPGLALIAAGSAGLLKPEWFDRAGSVLRNALIVIIPLLLIFIPVRSESRLKEFQPVLRHLEAYGPADFGINLVRSGKYPWAETAFFKAWIRKDLYRFRTVPQAVTGLAVSVKPEFLMVRTNLLRSEGPLPSAWRPVLDSGASRLFLKDPDSRLPLPAYSAKE